MRSLSTAQKTGSTVFHFILHLDINQGMDGMTKKRAKASYDMMKTKTKERISSILELLYEVATGSLEIRVTFVDRDYDWWNDIV
ncbi:hypothetical protein TNCV_1774101 [Trichonephila clavipes]|nr:hypothetical protein TNCV_1774101 [Trichonephila clavipes]